MTRYDIYIKTKLDNRVIVCKDKKFGVIDNKENVIIPVKYDKIEVNDTYNHFIVTQIHGYDKKYGLLDINAGVLLPVVYDTIETGYLRNIWYRLEKDNMKGLYNIIDKKEILYECDSLQIYDNGNSIIVKKGELYGIYDFNGEELIPVEYNNIFLISNGYICRKGKYYGVIDKSNNIVVDFEYSNIEERNNDVLECEQGNKCGLLTLTGEVILPCEYDKIQHLVNDLYGAFIKKTKKYCIVVAKKKIYWSKI